MSQPKIIADQIDSTNLVADELDNLDSTDFASSTHNHDADYSALGHNHNTDYYTKTQLNAGQLDTRYYTESEVDSLISPSAGNWTLINSITISTATQVYFTGLNSWDEVWVEFIAAGSDFGGPLSVRYGNGSYAIHPTDYWEMIPGSSNTWINDPSLYLSPNLSSNIRVSGSLLIRNQGVSLYNGSIIEFTSAQWTAPSTSLLRRRQGYSYWESSSPIERIAFYEGNTFGSTRYGTYVAHGRNF